MNQLSWEQNLNYMESVQLGTKPKLHGISPAGKKIDQGQLTLDVNTKCVVQRVIQHC